MLPIGISFYTFITLSYTIDVYRRAEQPCRSLLDFALYVGFFPHMVADPIVRPQELLPRFRSPRKATTAELAWGLALLLFGLFEKRVLADLLLAPIADKVFSGAGMTVSSLTAWCGATSASVTRAGTRVPAAIPGPLTMSGKCSSFL